MEHRAYYTTRQAYTLFHNSYNPGMYVFNIRKHLYSRIHMYVCICYPFMGVFMYEKRGDRVTMEFWNVLDIKRGEKTSG